MLIEATLHISTCALGIVLVCRDAMKARWTWAHVAGIAFLAAQILGVIVYIT